MGAMDPDELERDLIRLLEPYHGAIPEAARP